MTSEHWRVCVYNSVWSDVAALAAVYPVETREAALTLFGVYREYAEENEREGAEVTINDEQHTLLIQQDNYTPLYVVVRHVPTPYNPGDKYVRDATGVL